MAGIVPGLLVSAGALGLGLGVAGALLFGMRRTYRPARPGLAVVSLVVAVVGIVLLIVETPALGSKFSSKVISTTRNLNQPELSSSPASRLLGSLLPAPLAPWLRDAD